MAAGAVMGEFMGEEAESGHSFELTQEMRAWVRTGFALTRESARTARLVKSIASIARRERFFVRFLRGRVLTTDMSRRGVFCFLNGIGLAVGALMVGCRHVPVPVAARMEGRGAFEFVRPPAAPERDVPKGEVKRLPTDDEFVAPRAIGRLAEPVYPAVALAAGAGPVTLGLRLVVDTEGKVTDVSQSLLAFSTPTPWAAEFRAAAEAAVAQWRFRPAELRHFTTVTNAQGTYRSMTDSEKTEWALHVAFTFNATGGTVVETRATGVGK